MEVLFILLIISALVSFLFLGFYLWSVSNDQYDDFYQAQHKIFDDKPLSQPKL
ncbi:MAG: cbb3-type cytochrome oxidase assembly protein CcoS [Chitinophagales bacterium]|jgi:cbb3-type cytochrome oxidase maturation protein|nr:cbb3-type cytochrome oxidase assembly protein CcoS [Chitinophagales bacterium]